MQHGEVFSCLNQGRFEPGTFGLPATNGSPEILSFLLQLEKLGTTDLAAPNFVNPYLLFCGVD